MQGRTGEYFEICFEILGLKYRDFLKPELHQTE